MKYLLPILLALTVLSCNNSSDLGKNPIGTSIINIPELSNVHLFPYKYEKACVLVATNHHGISMLEIECDKLNSSPMQTRETKYLK
jgi:hypothetical protein